MGDLYAANPVQLGGLGYLEIKKPEEYDNLPKPLEEYPEKFVVTSSMTHQLHCLVSTRFERTFTERHVNG